MNIFIKTAFLTTAIFLVGIVFGLWLGQERVSQLETDLSSLRSGIDNAELQFLLLDVFKGNISCTYLLKEADSLGSESAELAVQVERYENAQKIDDTTFRELKSSYTALLIKDWLVLEKIKQTCAGNYATVLYFYSNEVCDRCQDQGIVLTYLKEKLKSELMVFAIDGDLGLNVVEGLKDSYSITEYPSLVINGEPHIGYQDLNTTTGILCDFNPEFSVCTA